MAGSTGALAQLAELLEMIKFQHAFFALPFALASAALAAREGGMTLLQIAWIVVAMVAARSGSLLCKTENSSFVKL